MVPFFSFLFFCARHRLSDSIVPLTSLLSLPPELSHSRGAPIPTLSSMIYDRRLSQRLPGRGKRSNSHPDGMKSLVDSLPSIPQNNSPHLPSPPRVGATPEILVMWVRVANLSRSALELLRTRAGLPPPPEEEGEEFLSEDGDTLFHLFSAFCSRVSRSLRLGERKREREGVIIVS